MLIRGILRLVMFWRNIWTSHWFSLKKNLLERKMFWGKTKSRKKCRTRAFSAKQASSRSCLLRNSTASLLALPSVDPSAIGLLYLELSGEMGSNVWRISWNIFCFFSVIVFAWQRFSSVDFDNFGLLERPFFHLILEGRGWAYRAKILGVIQQIQFLVIRRWILGLRIGMYVELCIESMD